MSSNLVRHFQILQFQVLHFHFLHFHAPGLRWSVIFMPCDLVRHFQVVHFQSPLFHGQLTHADWKRSSWTDAVQSHVPLSANKRGGTIEKDLYSLHGHCQVPFIQNAERSGIGTRGDTRVWCEKRRHWFQWVPLQRIRAYPGEYARIRCNGTH